MSDHDHGHIEEHIKVYLTVFGALAVLTLLTVSASYMDVSNTEEELILAGGCHRLEAHRQSGRK